ncbi:MAG: BrnT family toxin [Leptospirales bacterium]
MNKRNSPRPGDFLILQNLDDSCEHYLEYKKENQFEWDKNKNQKNIEKHNIAFDRIHDLFNDDKMRQMVEKKEKWEDLSNLAPSIDRNEGNVDPIRGKLIGNVDGKLYTAIYTFRDEIGKMRYRIISFRRANKNESECYNRPNSSN